MNNEFKKVTADFRAALVAKIADKNISDFITKTKETSDADTGTFKVVVSTADVDRQGDSVNQQGWDLSFFKSNPVVLWAHDYGSLPIGVCTSIEVQNGKLVAEGKFAPMEANPFAQQVRKLYELGMVRATSVGFIPKEYDQNNNSVISKSELLEFSFVPVPANPHALTLNQIKEFNFDTTMLKTKGIEVTIKEGETAPVVPVEPVAPVVVPADAPVEAKGEVNDELAMIQTREEKFKNYCKLMDAIDAFCSAYFDETTPVEDFSKLLSETADILKSIATGGVDGAKSAKESIAKMLGARKNIREQLTKNSELVEKFLGNLLKNYAILGSIELSEGAKNGSGDKAIETRSTSSALKEINAFVESRELLRSIDKSVEQVLANFNQAARTRQK